MRPRPDRSRPPLRRVGVLALVTTIALALGGFAAWGNASPAVTQQAPSNTERPTIRGNPHPGQALTARPGTGPDRRR